MSVEIFGVDRSDPTMRRLVKLGEERKRLRHELASLDRQAARLARDAHEHGKRKMDIAQALYVSRPTLDKMLRV